MKPVKGIMNKALKGLTFIVLIMAVANSCTKTVDNTPTPGAQDVFIQNMAFSPSTITVTAGSTVTWTNKDISTHTVTSDGGLFSSGSINSNETFSFKFNTPGTYPYHCTIHTSMTGNVVVN
jgi:plastocyanin